MSTKKVLLFDLDGTIADTLYAVIHIYNEKVAPRLRCRPVKWEDKVILQNQPVGELFRTYGISWFKLPLVIYQVKRQLQKQIDTIVPFPGIREVLHQLKSEGYTLGIVTSNSEKNASAFLKQHRLIALFDFVYTNRNIFGKHKTLEYLIKKHRFQKQDVLYIGDETRDIHAARKAGIGIIAVSWGYLSRESLLGVGPDVVIDEVEELVETVEGYFGGGMVVR